MNNIFLFPLGLIRDFLYKMNDELSKSCPLERGEKITIPKCEYVLTRGTRKGEKCGKDASFSHNNKWYCGTWNKEGNFYLGHIRIIYVRDRN